MFFVYIIQSINFPKQLYTGFSENFEERLDEPLPAAEPTGYRG
jgi:predicted GIY-YIG superfamily endonuclease